MENTNNVRENPKWLPLLMGGLLIAGVVAVLFVVINLKKSAQPSVNNPAVTVTPKATVKPTTIPMVVPASPTSECEFTTKGGLCVPTSTPTVQKSGEQGVIGGAGGMENPGLTGNPGGSKSGKDACTDPKPKDIVYTNSVYDEEDKQYLGDHGKEAIILEVNGQGILVVEFTQDKFSTPVDCRSLSFK